MAGKTRYQGESKGPGCGQIIFFLIIIALTAINEFKQVSEKNDVRHVSGKMSPQARYSALRGNIAARTDEELFSQYQSGRLKGIIDPLYGRRLIHLAAELNRPGLIKMLVDSRENVNAQDSSKNTPLHTAMEAGSKDAAAALIECRADVLAENVHNQSILHFACNHGFYEVALLAIKSGAPVKKEATGKWQPIHYAACKGHMRIVVLLAENGADLSAPLGYGWTAGDMAFDKHKEIANFLHSRNATFAKFHLMRNYRLVDGWPFFDDKQIKQLPYDHPVFRAVAEDSSEKLAQLAAEGTNLNIGNSAKTPVLCLAIAHGSSKAAEFLINHLPDLELTDANEKTALFYSIENSNKPITRLLIEKKVNLSHTDLSGNTPLHYAIARCDNDIAAELIDKGADIFAKNHYARGMMHVATENGNEVMFATLINNGCDVNQEDVKGNTPLHLAVMQDNIRIVSALLKNGADFAVRNNQLRAPIQLAKSDAVRQILSNRFEVEGVNPAERNVPAEVQVVPVKTEFPEIPEKE